MSSKSKEIKELVIQKNNIKNFAEFFAGVGLVRMGLESSGWQCNFANDFDIKKKEIYDLNFGGEEFKLKDIWDLDISEIPEKTDLYTASFPCTDLSVAGNQKGIKAERSGTFWALIEILKKAKKNNTLPKIVLLENVYGFITINKGQDIIEAIKNLNKIGYYTDILLVDAKNFTPQSRPRIFVINILESDSRNIMFRRDETLFSKWNQILNQHLNNLRPKKIVDLIIKNKDINWGLMDLPPLPKRNNNLVDIVERLNENDPRWWNNELSNKILKQIKTEHFEILKMRMETQNLFFGTLYRRMRNGEVRAELRSDGIAGCLRTPGGGSSKQIIVQSGNGKIKFRWMTPREYARLQGVPDSFKLAKNDIQSLFAMGDAVCVPVIKWISENVIEQVYNKNYSSKDINKE